jgi:Acyl-protein synthetase, LuxE
MRSRRTEVAGVTLSLSKGGTDPTMATYETEARELDAEILATIDAWNTEGRSLDDAAFNVLALRIFAHQLRYNSPYARYCEQLGITLEAMPASWEAIPGVPAAAFKEAALATFDPARATLAFETSGTTRGTPGRHYMETTALYDASLLAGFDRFMLSDGARLRYFNLVPNPLDRPQSSLGYMMARVAAQFGTDDTGWYLHGETLDLHALLRDLRRASDVSQPVCIATTAFALVHTLNVMERERKTLRLPPGSRIMETGGFKGRTRIVTRDDLYARTSELLDIPPDKIVAEYGMTELTSQYYDVNATTRAKSGPPWLRARIVGPDRTTLPNGKTGSLLHVDLANRASCIAVQTDDLGVREDDGFVLLGRDREAEPRGCSLDAPSG